MSTPAMLALLGAHAAAGSSSVGPSDTIGGVTPSLWYNFADSGTVTESSGVISAIADQGTTGADLTSVSGSPTINTHTLNGNAVAYFGGSDSLRAPNFTFVISQPFTVFYVFQPDAYSGECLDGTNIGSGRHIIRPQGGGGWGYETGSALASGNSSTSAMLWCVKVNGASSIIRINGTQVASGDVGTNDIGNVTLYGTYDGSPAGAGTAAQYALYPAVLSDTDCGTVETSMMAYWGL